MLPASPYIASNLAANLQNDLGALIESPVFTNGIGTVYFEAINSLQATPTAIFIDIATNMTNSVGAVIGTVNPPSTNGLYYAWATQTNLTLNAATSNDFTRYSGLLNYRQPIKLRIRRGDYQNGAAADSDFTVIDNIRVSSPPSDVTVYGTTALNLNGNRTLRCFVSNVDTNALTTSRTVTGYYRWLNLLPPDNVWTNVPMSLTDAGDGNGNNERYEAALPFQPLGTNLEYYVVCSFDGYWYQSPDYTGLGYTNYVSELRSPFTTAHQTNLFARVGVYTLTVTNGTGTGSSYTNGQQVAVTAYNMTGQAFFQWTGDTQYVASVTSPSTTVTMPSNSVSITATYTNLYYALTVTGGSGGGSYTNGQVVLVTASNLTGKVFDRWTGDASYVTTVTSAVATVTMPATNITITATYIDIHTLTVNSGTGGGSSYTNGQLVSVTASNLTGKVFDRWTGATAYVASVTSPNTTVTMPAFDIAITATYIDIHTLTVNSGTGGGSSYTNGQQVAVAASNLTGKVFDRWTGNTAYLASVTSPNTTVTMPAFDIAITATYLDLYMLTVTNGTGSGSSYTNGQQVAITANAPLTGMAFARWTGATQNVASVFSPNTTVTMPAANIGLTATYSNLLYTLTVTSGSGSGSYTNGQQVAVTAAVRSDRTFVQWTGDIAYVASVTSSSTTVTMPAAAVNITAMYTMTTSLLTENRILQFDDYALTNNAPPTWVHEGSAPKVVSSDPKTALLAGTNHYHRTGWFLRACRTGCAGYIANARIIPPKSPGTLPASPYIAANLAANMQNDLNALIESPVITNGIGTVYFEAINDDVNYPTKISVDIATNMYSAALGTTLYTVNPPSTNGYDLKWETLDSLNLNAATSNDFTRYSRMLNYRGSFKLRIRRMDYQGSGVAADSAFTVIDNIRVSLPPADIAITKTVSPFEPGYPSVGTNLTIRCYVSNVDTNVPTDSPRSLKVIYRWRFLNQVIGPWRTNAMAYVAGTGDGAGNGERYAAVLPPIADIGDLEYYFVGDFMGYVYQSPDYTGTGLTGVPAGSPGVYPYASENLTPRTFRGTAGGGQEFSTRLRPYTSRFGALYAETDQLADPVAMALSGNGEWRAMAPLAGTGITNLTWRFKATGEYVPGSEQFSTGVTYWAAVSGVKGGSVPYGGFCVVTNADGRLSVGVDSGNYAMLTLNTESLQYLATRAEYQNFNRWPAPANFFSESNGQDPKTSILNTFDAWPTNAYPPTLDARGQGVSFEPIIGYPVTTNSYMRDPFTTPLGWVAGSAAYVSERPFDKLNEPVGVFNFRNLALRLKGGDGALGLGYVHNSVVTLPDGLKEFSFKCRLGQGALDTDIAYYRNGFTSYNYGFWANASILANCMSPETPSLSVIGYYQDADHFYEYRVTQIKDTRDTEAVVYDQGSRHELYKWVNGVATRLASVDVATVTLFSTQPLYMRFYNTDGAHTLIKCRYNATDYITFTDGTAPVIQSGSFGVLSAECLSGFSNIYYQPTDSSANLTGSQTAVLTSDSNFDSQVPNWYVPAGRFVANGNAGTKGIYSVLPNQQLGVYVQSTTYSQNNNTEPSAPGGSGWQLLTKVTVTNFSYQTVTIPFNSWQSQYVMLQVIGGAADVAVDEMKVSSWHGTQSGHGDVDQYDWLATEAWVVSNSTASANAVQLDFSRANPAVDQMIRAPLLDTGLGMMEFDYRVTRAPAKMTVQYARRSDNTVWTDVQSFVVSNVVGWTHAAAYLGLPVPGYFRLLNDERTAGYTNAFVEIDNVTVWDEPNLTNSAWRAYNAKITQTDTNRVMLDASAACFLNNSQTAEASPSPLSTFQPYLMSPVLPKGLGTLSFYARAYTNTQAATLYIYATTNGWNAPENQWFEISRVDNITNIVYQLYTCVPVDGRAYNAVKLGKKISDGTGRVCLDEVIVSEPVLPGFDIINVRLLVRNSDGSDSDRNQPLDGEDTDVEARMGNIHLSPSNIVMYVSYYVGTNAWGIGNWPASQVVTRRMHPVSGDPTLYRTRPDNGGIAGLPDSQIGGILGQDHDQVVQYYVWATYVGGIPLTTQQATFDNPSWYFPVDLNATFASQGWSPYYFVYVVPVGAVWINEINATDYMTNQVGQQIFGVWGNQYIEIAIPAWLNLAGWSVDLVTLAGTSTITIPAGLPEQTAVTNGYAFFVIGDAAPPSDPRTPALPKKDYGYPGLSSDMPRILPGGLRLKRPLGMYEQTIAYDWDPTSGGVFSGALWAASDPEQRFIYVGVENNGGSLARVGLYDSTSTWVFPQTWTPGAPNIGQMLPSNGTYVPGVSNVVVTSLMNLDKGTQNGKRSTYYALKMRKGTGTNIVYQIDDWYRLSSLTANQVEQLPLGSALRSYNLTLPNLQANVDISADIRLRSDLADYSNNSSVLNWILGFQDGALIPMYYNNRLLSMTEQYWLDANPTVSNTFECVITKFVLDPGTNFHLTVKMALNGVKETSLQGSAVLKLQSKSRIDGQEWQLLAQYSLSSASFDANNLCRVYVPDPFAFILQGVDPRSLFFRWVIELPDPRVSVQDLVNDLTP